MKHKVIFVLVSLWLVGTFALEALAFFGSLGTAHVTIPLFSSVGFVAWLAMVLRRKWGSFIFDVYLIFLGFYAVQDIVHGGHRVYSVCALVVLAAVGLPLATYFHRHTGLCWKTREPVESSSPDSE